MFEKIFFWLIVAGLILWILTILLQIMVRGIASGEVLINSLLGLITPRHRSPEHDPSGPHDGDDQTPGDV